MTALPNTKKLILDLEKGWLTVWFNSPKNRNALSEELAGELKATLDAIRDDRSVRGVTLRGKGGIFCAGGDLKAFMAGLIGGASHDDVAAMNKGGGDLFQMVNTAPQVIVAVVEGRGHRRRHGISVLRRCCDRRMRRKVLPDRNTAWHSAGANRASCGASCGAYNGAAFNADRRAL